MGQCGRLVVVAEKQLKSASKAVLRRILEDAADVTFVAGLERGAVISAGRECGKIIYNSMEYMPLEEMAGMMEWREIWVVAGGRAWRAQPQDMVD
jgi:hypothetical protein